VKRRGQATKTSERKKAPSPSEEGEGKPTKHCSLLLGPRCHPEPSRNSAGDVTQNSPLPLRRREGSRRHNVKQPSPLQKRRGQAQTHERRRGQFPNAKKPPLLRKKGRGQEREGEGEGEGEGEAAELPPPTRGEGVRNVGPFDFIHVPSPSSEGEGTGRRTPPGRTPGPTVKRIPPHTRRGGRDVGPFVPTGTNGSVEYVSPLLHLKERGQGSPTPPGRRAGPHHR
jgi:hypothetical protein